MFEHNNTKTYEDLIGLESDKKLIHGQDDEGDELDDEALDQFDKDDLNDELKYDKGDTNVDDDDTDLEEGGVGMGDDWGEYDEDEIEAELNKAEHEDL